MDDDVPAWPPVGGPFDGVNAAFHEAYDDARGRAEDAAPVIVLVDDALVVFHRGRERRVPVTPRLFHVLKSAAHAPLAIFVAIARGASADDRFRRLAAMRAPLEEALRVLPAEIPDADMAAEARAALEASRAFVEAVLSGARSPDAAAADELARATGPGLLRLVDLAAGVELRALDAAVEEALATLTLDEQRALEVVVVGSHQARERSMALQYFAKRFGEPPGAEERVAFAEALRTASEALALVGARRFDRRLAGAFFGDPKRLQRDVLGDAAKARLDAVTLAPIPK